MSRREEGLPSLQLQVKVTDTPGDVCLSATDSAFGHEDVAALDHTSLLPFEVAVQILCNATTLRQVKCCLSLSRKWHQAASDNAVWKSLFRTVFGSEALAKTSANLTRRNFWGPDSPFKSRPAHPAFPFSPSSSLCNESDAMYFDPNSLSEKMTLDDSNHPERTWKYVFRQRWILHTNWREGNYTARSFTGHADAVYCIQFDGDLLTSGSRDRTLKFWDMDTLNCLRTLSGHEGSILCMQHDAANYIVTGSSDSTAILWDYKTGKPIRRLMGHTLPVLDIRFDATRIVTCSKDCTIRIWNLNTGTLLHTLEGHQAAVNAVHMHGDHVVSASGDCVVKLWDMHRGTLLRTFVGHTRGLACVQYDGSHVLSGSNDFTIKIWDARTGACLKTLEGHSNLVRTLCFDNERVVSGSYDYTIKVWDRRSGECLYTLDNSVHMSWVFHVQMDASRIVSSAQDKRIAIWDFAHGCDLAKDFS